MLTFVSYLKYTTERNMMRIVVALLVLTSIEVSAQGQFQVLDQYKYFVVNTSMFEGARDPYNASTYLRQKLFGLKYQVIAENEVSWPDELTENPCLALWINVVTIPKAFGDYQVALDFYNCQNITVLSLNGKGSGANSSEAFHRAIDKALRSIKNYPHNFKPDLALLKPKRNNTELDSLLSYFEHAKLEPFEGIYGFSSGVYTYRMGIKKVDEEFVGYVINSDHSDWVGGEVKGRFNRSNRPDLFSVKWYLDDKSEYDTFGYINENGSLTIEFKKPDNEYQPLTVNKF